MTTLRKRLLALLTAVVMLAAACNHPIEIVGEGDVLSASGTRDCTFADHEAGSPNCTENTVTGGAYDETYTGVAAPGWHFHRWATYCTDTTGPCSVGADASTVAAAQGETATPLVAIFRPDVITGFDSVFIGHSFFNPFAQGMNFHATNAGFTDHTQGTVFSGGATGAPEALWNNANKRAQIQALLDTGDVDLFAMTYHPTYPTLTGYRLWIDYALAQNPDTRIALALPWLPNPGSFTAANYAASWNAAHETLWHDLVDDLRDEYPGTDIYGIPYGQAAGELYELYAAGQLPDVDTLVSGNGDAIFRDAFGHADDILVDLGRLVWLRAIYGVDLETYAWDPGYQVDLAAIATAIMDEHDPAYNAP